MQLETSKMSEEMRFDAVMEEEEDNLFDDSPMIANLDVDFGQLNKRSLSTSTPFFSRANPICPLPRPVPLDFLVESSMLSLPTVLLKPAQTDYCVESSMISNFSGQCMISVGNTTVDSGFSSTCTFSVSDFTHTTPMQGTQTELTQSPLAEVDSAYESSQNSQSQPMSDFSEEGDLCTPPSSALQTEIPQEKCHQKLDTVFKEQTLFSGKLKTHRKCLYKKMPSPSPTVSNSCMHSTPVHHMEIGTPVLSPDEGFESMLKNFSPVVPDRLIGRKMGLDYVDIVAELCARNIGCLSAIFSYLSPADLVNVLLVSDKWRQAAEGNQIVHRRITRYQDTINRLQRRAKKENSVTLSPRKKCRELTKAHGPLQDVQHAAPIPLSSVPLSPLPTKYDTFIAEAQKLKNDEALIKCHRCMHPAKVHKVQERAWCTNQSCNFDFCIKCLSCFHGSKECTFSALKKTKSDNAVGTKKSRKNLRRL